MADPKSTAGIIEKEANSTPSLKRGDYYAPGGQLYCPQSRNFPRKFKFKMEEVDCNLLQEVIESLWWDNGSKSEQREEKAQ